jgi:hypothetical protein
MRPQVLLRAGRRSLSSRASPNRIADLEMNDSELLQQLLEDITSKNAKR